MLKKPMEKEIKNKYSEFNKKDDVVRFRISGDRILAESATSVLVNVMEDSCLDIINPDRMWISKKLVFKPEYGTHLNIYVRESYSFDIFDDETENEKESQETISAKELCERIALKYGYSKI